MSIHKILFSVLIFEFIVGFILLTNNSKNESSNDKILPTPFILLGKNYPRISAPYPSISIFDTRHGDLYVEVAITDSKIEFTKVSEKVKIPANEISALKIGFKNRSTKDCMLKLVTDLGGLEAVWAPAGILTYDDVYSTHPLALQCNTLPKKDIEGDVIVRTTTPGEIRDPNTPVSEQDPTAFFIVFKGKKPGAYIVKVGIESKDFPSVQTLQLPVLIY